MSQPIEALIQDLPCPKIQMEKKQHTNYNDFLTSISDEFSILYQKSTMTLFTYNIQDKTNTSIKCPILFSSIILFDEGLLIGFSDQKFYKFNVTETEFVPIVIETQLKQITKMGIDYTMDDSIFCYSDEDFTVYRINIEEFGEPEVICTEVDLYSPAVGGIFVSQSFGVTFYKVDNSNISEVFTVPYPHADAICGGDLVFSVQADGKMHIFNQSGQEIETMPSPLTFNDQAESVLYINDCDVIFTEPYIGEYHSRIIAGGIVNRKLYYWTAKLKCFETGLPAPKINVQVSNQEQTGSDMTLAEKRRIAQANRRRGRERKEKKDGKGQNPKKEKKDGNGQNQKKGKNGGNGQNQNRNYKPKKGSTPKNDNKQAKAGPN